MASRTCKHRQPWCLRCVPCKKQRCGNKIFIYIHVQAQAALVSALRALQKKKVWKIYICASTGSLGVCAACLAKNKGVKCFAVRCNLDAMAHVVCTPLCDLFCTACLAKSEGENKGNSVFAFLQPALPCTCWVLGVLVGCWVSLLGVGCPCWVSGVLIGY